MDVVLAELEEVRPSILLMLTKGFNARIGALNQVSEEAFPLGVGTSATRDVFDRDVCKRGSALVEGLAAYGFVFLNCRFGGDCAASRTRLSTSSVSTINLASRAFLS